MSANIPMLGAPTASGKSRAAIELALGLRPEVEVEIVTADAMQVYTGMDIGTAKPTASERQLVNHHLLDLLSPAEPFSVAAWVAAAEQVIAQILGRGALPLVVGGTGFYLRSLTDGLPLVPAAEEALQAPIWAEVERDGLAPLLAELAEASPADAERAGLNPRRVVRAVEILRSTGRAPSGFGRSQPAFSFSQVVLLPTMAQLAPRIAQRANEMFAHGLVAEVQGLLERWPQQLTSVQAIGYKEVVARLQGDGNMAAAAAAVEQATARYAKRQLTWFRREHQARQLPGLAPDFMPELRAWLLSCAG